MYTDPSGKCLGWLWGDPNCQFAGTDYTKYDYTGAGQVVVSGLGVAATVVACGATVGVACAAGAAGAAAVTSWGNQALDNAGQPVAQAISNVNPGVIARDAAIAAVSAPLLGLVGKGAGKLVDAIASRVVIHSDLAISRLIARAAPLAADEIGPLLASRGFAGRMAERWLNLRGLSVLYRGQGSQTTAMLSPLARQEGIAASEGLIARLRAAGFTDKQIAGFTARYHNGPVPPTGECLGAAGIPSTRIPGVAGPYAGETGNIYALRVPKNLPIKPDNPWYPAEYEMVFFNQILKGSIVKRLPSKIVPWLTALEDDLGRLTVTTRSIYP